MTFSTVSNSRITALSTTASSVEVPVDSADISGNGFGVRLVEDAMIVNEHSSNIVYAAVDRTASATDFDMAIIPGEPAKLKIGGSARTLSLVASAGSTPVSVMLGRCK